jgi:hypothetical protein
MGQPRGRRTCFIPFRNRLPFLPDQTSPSDPPITYPANLWTLWNYGNLREGGGPVEGQDGD